MSDQIKHECGIAMIRLLKPLDYYQKKYGTVLFGLNKLYLLMQKQHNRGQDGAGIATIKLNALPGKRYISRHRSPTKDAIEDIFAHVHNYFRDIPAEKMQDAEWLKANYPYIGELLLGHLRYGTHGQNSKETCHPFLRQTNWITRNLVLAGNFNLTNVHQLIDELIELGQYPKEKTDTVTILEKIGHFLDDEVQRLYDWYKSEGFTNQEINNRIFDELNVQRILSRASKKFDGGYVMAGMIGHGDAFVMRDAAGIRPAFYYHDDEVVVVASERPAIQTAFNVHISKVKELKPAHALIIKCNGTVTEEQYIEAMPKTSCSFESIYFSRGNDRDIYNQRKKLGRQLAKSIMKAANYDFKKTVFSFVPNTAEVAFYGMVEGIEEELNIFKATKIRELGKDLKGKRLDKILSLRPRVEKLVVKDAKLRTFIADDASRGELVSHVYDVTYGVVANEKDTIVLMDDSIVRGTTLKKSILRIVSRLRPKKIMVVSSAPQIRYPDCYGIDMSKMHQFVAFKALIALIKENKMEHLLEEAYNKCKEQENIPIEEMVNHVIPLYDLFKYEEISKKIAEIVTPPSIKPEVEVIYQTIEGLHQACPSTKGDWYFTGNYPTPGGNRIVNKAFTNFMEDKNVRAY